MCGRNTYLINKKNPDPLEFSWNLVDMDCIQRTPKLAHSIDVFWNIIYTRLPISSMTVSWSWNGISCGWIFYSSWCLNATREDPWGFLMLPKTTTKSKHSDQNTLYKQSTILIEQSKCDFTAMHETFAAEGMLTDKITTLHSSGQGWELFY